MDYDYSTGISLTSNVSLTGGNAGHFMTSSSNGFTWSTPKYVDDHLEAAGGIQVMRQQELRKQHPALQEAWEAYLVILYLCNEQQ